jgi:hypothetical protein
MREHHLSQSIVIVCVRIFSSARKRVKYLDGCLIVKEGGETEMEVGKRQHNNHMHEGT